jgi:hypothetical protein
VSLCRPDACAHGVEVVGARLLGEIVWTVMVQEHIGAERGERRRDAVADSATT